jgi:hypothetical protein
MKNLLITVCSNYVYDNIFPWITSAIKYCKNTDILIFINKNDRNTIKK